MKSKTFKSVNVENRKESDDMDELDAKTGAAPYKLMI